jgi:pyruvate dehydrogenase E1 component alpha subunit
MAGMHVDGNDVQAMYSAGREAVQRARDGGGPTLIEAMTYRFHGHVFGDSDAYISKEEKAAALAADPVPRYRAALLDAGGDTERWLTDTEKQIETEIDEAVEFALASPFPPLSELTRDVLAEETVS